MAGDMRSTVVNTKGSNTLLDAERLFLRSVRDLGDQLKLPEGLTAKRRLLLEQWSALLLSAERFCQATVEELNSYEAELKVLRCPKKK